MNEFKDRLKLLRTLLGLSQAEMARKLGIARSRLSELEAGKTKPRDSILRLISHTFGVSYRWLKEGEGEMWERKEEPPVWLKEFLEGADEKELKILKALIDMLKEVPDEEKDLLFLMLKKLAGASRKK